MTVIEKRGGRKMYLFPNHWVYARSREAAIKELEKHLEERGI